MAEFTKFKYLISDLSMDFTIYHQLFYATSSVQVLNDFNALIFSNYQKCLLNSIYSKVSRLLDPAYSDRAKKNTNLSFLYFIETFSLSNDQEIAEKLNAINKTFKESNLKKYRNKILSHNDVKSVMSKEILKVDLNVGEIENLILSFRSLCGLIEYKDGRCEYNYTILPHITLPRTSDGHSFLQKLKESI